MRLILAFSFIFCSIGSWAQLVQVPIVKNSKTKNKIINNRVQELSAMKLPFWDDFSFTHGKDYPNDSLWQYGHSVWVNDGMGIDPPTMNVGTFDGIDSLGHPYSLTATAKGNADKLISRPLRLDLVDPSKRDLIFIFFYYQYEGNGEAPNLPDDVLSLWFKSVKNDTIEWIQVWTAPIDSTSDKTKFIPVKLQIGNANYFHDSFQFRFQNFARLSGPFDTWNLDYVYINNGEIQYPHQYADLPDRAVTTKLTSSFKQYYSLPVKHFLANPDSILTYPSATVTSQRTDQTVEGQSVNIDSYLTISTRLNKTTTQNTVRLDSAASGTAIYYGKQTRMTIGKLPDLSGLDKKIDSISLRYQMKLNAGDNFVKVNQNVFPDSVGNDYDTIVYKGIDFRYNDTTRADFILKNYYAYDDGVAEYAVTLTQPGANLAYQFDMAYSQPDTLVAVDVYFPHVGDESEQVILLKVWSDLSKRPVDSLVLNVKRTENNNFLRVPLDHGILVQDEFFVGWKQNTTATIGVGFDKNSDSGDKIFYNLAGSWVQNTDLHGNLMIRPVFGNKDLNTEVGIEEGNKLFAYPNPNRGVFYLPASAQAVQIMDIAGRNISFVEESSFDQKQITISSPSSGLYFARYFNGSSWRTEKILVLP